MSVGAWDEHYEGLTDVSPYGDDTAYRLAAEWVAGCNPIEDWGCGKGWLRRFVDPDAYVGLDGSHSPFADKVVDLGRYTSQVEGIVMRGVLEHNLVWEPLLDNALASFTRRFALVVFTPMADETRVLFTEPDYGDVPVISFRLEDLTERFPSDVTYAIEEKPTGSYYGFETFFFIER